MSKLRIPGNRLDQRYKALGEELDEAVAKVISRGVFTPSIEVEAFENEMAAFTGRRYAVAVSLGTAALHLCLLALGVSEGQKVIVPSYVCTALLHAV